jgi:uncharacterized repeat protein (TIGR01451 family)
MMKKNYTNLFLLLLLICFSNWSSYGQTPIANNDDITLFPPFCQPSPPYQILINDGLFGPESNYTIDLNPLQPGIQDNVISQFGALIQVQGSMITYMSLGGINMPFDTATYTIQDGLGNVSNVATINFNLIQFFSLINSTNTSCETNNGSITIDYFSEPTTINVSKDSVFMQSYDAQPGDPQLVIAGLSAGNYTVVVSTPCSGVLYYNLYIRIISPLTGSFTPTYVDYNSDGITNVGDLINYEVAVTNTSNSCTMNDVEIYNGVGPQNGITYINNGLIATFSAGASDTSSLNFYRVLEQSDINNGNVQRVDFIGASNPLFLTSNAIFTDLSLNITNGIKLNAFLDNNNNGVQDNNEPNYTQGTFGYTINSEPIHNVNTSTGELYLYESNPATVYNLSYNIDTNNNFCGSQYLVATSSFSNVTVAPGSGITTYNFPITVVPCDDVAIYLYAGGNPRPGFIYYNYITYTNEGNQVASGTINFTRDSALTLLSNSENAPMTADGFSYNYTNLNPGESRVISVAMQVPTIPTVTLGQSLTNSLNITPADGNPSNNASTLTRNIVGSYDPNDKTESHGGKILHSGFTANDYLTYTIRFENTGTAEAINIRVNDILDEKLDPTSIKMVRASHPYVLDRVGNNLTWRFDGVNLPPSIPGDEVTGHGYIVFQIKPASGFAIGDIIPNTADIFFDFNPAIVTNTCTTEFVPFLGVNVFESDTFEYYPNPTSDSVTFNLKNTSTAIETIEVMDVLGKTLLIKTNNYSNASIDLSSLSKGVYLVKVKAAGQEKTVKITKK